MLLLASVLPKLETRADNSHRESIASAVPLHLICAHGCGPFCCVERRGVHRQ